MGDQVWILYEHIVHEDMKVMGIYTSPELAEARKVELETKWSEQGFRYYVVPANLNEDL